MFLYFFENNLNNSNHFQKYSQSLIDNFVFLNSKGVYFNKLTWMLFQRILPQGRFTITININSRNILTNLLHPKISESNLKDWVDLFMIMFQFYPFKQLLLRTYINNFSLIYDTDIESLSKGTSISCQLLTSFQLVKDYV